jgi:DNA-binding transcriptional MocR family regulator
VYRALLEHPIWQLSPGQRCVWFTILARANHKPGEWFDGRERVEIPAGSFVTSQPHLAEAAGVSRIVVRHALSNLEVLGSIRAKMRAKRWTLIEVVNWPLYQGADDEVSQEESPRRAKGEPRASHNLRMKEGKKSTPANGLPPGFVVWWTEYPKKVGKIQAIKEWENLSPEETLRTLMLEALRKQKHTVKAMLENDLQHILDPERWLKYRRWEDELTAAPNSVQQYPRL